MPYMHVCRDCGHRFGDSQSLRIRDLRHGEQFNVLVSKPAAETSDILTDEAAQPYCPKCHGRSDWKSAVPEYGPLY